MTEFRNNQPLSSAKSLLFRSGNLFQRGLKLSHLRMIVAMEETGQISLAAAAHAQPGFKDGFHFRQQP